MFRRRGFYIAIAVTIIAVASLAAWAAPRQITDDMMAASARTERGGSLDQAYNQLRYIKTTDFGATWNTAQAGDLSAFSPYDNLPFGDFSAVTMANGELCYLIALEHASTPGIYALAGPNFTPVLVRANGSDSLFVFGYTNGGHADISRAPDGSLVGIFWGKTSTGANTVWACKSTNNGANWNSWVIATEPALPANSADFGWFKLPDRCSNQWDWAVYQIPVAAGQWDIKVIRFDHSTTNAGTIVSVDFSGHQYSFMFGGLKPVAYDPANNWVYLVFRDHDLSGVLVYSSDDLGATFLQAADVPSPLQRYPSIALRAATQTPFMAYGRSTSGLGPDSLQCTYDSYDEGGYGAGLWTDIAQLQCVILQDGTAGWNSIYFPQMWWWDATHGYAQFDGYTNFLLGEIIETSRTTDGGASWVDFGTRVHYATNQFIAGTMQPSEVVGGENGLGFIIFSACPGITDEQAPTVSNPEVLTSPIGLGPYVVRAYYNDNVGIRVDDPAGHGPWVNWNVGPVPTPSTVLTATPDSTQVDANNRGWYYYTIPGPFVLNDTIWIYCDGYDVSGLYNDSYETNSNYPYIVAGVAYFGANDPAPAMPTAFALHSNYPNPFNPETQISFDLAAPAQVTLSVYNTLGQMVAKLADHRSMNTGTYSLTFNGANLPSGVYLYRLVAGSFSQTRKMVMVK
jgi:hypothetical protein